MAAVRVTQRLLVDRILNNLSDQSRELLKLQDQLATGRRVNKPSDDPLAARRALNAQNEISANNQYITNISTISPGLLESETTSLSVVDMLQRARELTLQGANGTNAQEQLDQIAIEVNQLLEGVLNQGNQITNDRYIFGGTRTSNPPFVATRDASGEIISVAYEGNDEDILIEISEGVQVVSNATGESVFQSTSASTVDIYQMLIDVRDNLRAGDSNGLQTRLEELTMAQDQLLLAVSRLGATQNRINRVEDNLSVVNVQLQEVLSDNVDADFAEVTLNLNAQFNAYQAALNAGARVIQPSLLDFVR